MQEIRELFEQIIQSDVSYSVEHPRDESHGDYSVNVAMILGKRLGKNPRELAEAIVGKLTANSLQQTAFEKAEVAGPGFINLFLKKEFLLGEMQKATETGYGKNERLKGKKVMVEYTDPNPFKEMHIGHLMSNTIGESLARLLEMSGAEVKRACYQGDVGLHVAKSVWGMKQKLQVESIKLQEIAGWDLNKRQKFMGEAYALGATKYEEDEEVKATINGMNKEIYQGLDLPGDSRKAGVMELYRLGREWSLEYFETIYQRLGTKFDEYFFESEAGPVGLKVVEEGLKKGVLELGEGGAVVYHGEKEGLHTRVFRNKIGLATYEGKELGLAKTKYERYAYDLSYIVTANEITEYFKVLLSVMKQLYPELATKTTHIPHGMMKLKSGKMSSRTGKVITGEGLLNELKEVVLAKMGERKIGNREQVADMVAVSSLKYTVLKQAIGGDITYEPEKITNLEGDTGPYLQYSYVRAISVLAKAKQTQRESNSKEAELSELELKLLKWIYRYPEVVKEASEKYAPHMVAFYVYELAQRFNSLYNQEQIVGHELRIKLTQAVSQILKSGLDLLGISVPEEM